MPKIRVFIADDHALVRQGIRALLAQQPDLEVVGEAENGASLVEPCKKLKPHIVLMDLSMPGRGGIGATEDLRLECPDARIVAVTMHEDEAYARQAFLAGAMGYVLKKSVVDDLITAIRVVSKGERFVPESLAESIKPQNQTPRRLAAERSINLLSPRELEVLGILAVGHTNAEAARRLHISEKTVETHRMRLLRKLGLQTRADLVRFAIEHKIAMT